MPGLLRRFLVLQNAPNTHLMPQLVESSHRQWQRQTCPGRQAPLAPASHAHLVKHIILQQTVELEGWQVAALASAIHSCGCWITLSLAAAIAQALLDGDECMLKRRLDAQVGDPAA
jgi:hypothetical protein